MDRATYQAPLMSGYSDNPYLRANQHAYRRLMEQMQNNPHGQRRPPLADVVAETKVPEKKVVREHRRALNIHQWITTGLLLVWSIFPAWGPQTYIESPPLLNLFVGLGLPIATVLNLIVWGLRREAAG